MKKLISLLMPLLMLGCAAAEDAASVEVIPVVEQGIHIGDLLSKGLIVTAGGLLGVFLVLILFFFCIKLMQKIKN